MKTLIFLLSLTLLSSLSAGNNFSYRQRTDVYVLPEYAPYMPDNGPMRGQKYMPFYWNDSQQERSDRYWYDQQFRR